MKATLDGHAPHRLRTLGGLELTDPAGAPVPAHRRELLLLAYLAGRPRAADTRLALATLLWEDRDERRARGSLRQALFRLRGVAPDLLQLEGDVVALVPGRLAVDAATFLRLAADGELERARAAWTGDFLAGEEPPDGSALREWVAAERARLAAAYRRVLERCIEQAEGAGAWADAVRAAEGLLALDPLDVDAGGRLAGALRRAGEPAAALDALDALIARRRAELDAGPPPRLTALVEEVRAELRAREAAAARAALRRPSAVGIADASAEDAPAAAIPAEARARVLAAWRHVGEGADPLLVTGAAAARARLLGELQSAAAAAGAVVLAARGAAADAERPWSTARPLLAPLADAPGLAGLAPAALARLAQLVPAVRDGFAALPAAEPDDWATLDAARAAIEEVAVEVPVLVAVDELPRADAFTRQLVLALARRLPVAGLCLAVGGSEAEFAAMDEGAPLLALPSLHRVALAPLAAAVPAGPAASSAPSSPVPPGPRRRVLAGAALALAVVAAGTAWVRRGSDAVLEPSLVAVAPFDVADADLALWRHGMVDVLARRLDGAGPLRTVPPTTVVRRFTGRGDPEGAAALGARTGAGFVVYGGVIHAGRDSVGLEARLFDVRERRVVGEVRVRGALDGMDRAIDSLGIGLLRELARARPLGAVHTAGIEGVSLPALRAFLAAEQHYRAGRFQEAVREAEAALTLDGDFALARHRLGTLLLYDEDAPVGAAHLMRAAQTLAATPRALAPRDSVVLSVDSLRGALVQASLASADGAPLPLRVAHLDRLRGALVRFPDDPELRLAHAEALVAYGDAVGSTREEQHAAYGRAVVLDPGFFPAHVAAVGLALATHRPERAREHLAAMRALAAPRGSLAAVEAMERTIRPAGQADTLALARWLARAPLDELAAGYLLAGDWPDETGTVLRILRRGEVLAKRERPEVWARFVEPLLRARLDERGRLVERRALGGEGAASGALVRDAMLGALPLETGDRAAASWLAGDAPWDDPQPLVWLARRGDAAGLRRFLARESAAPREPGDAARGARARGRRLAQAYLVLVRHDTAAALAQLDAVEWRACADRCLANALYRAQLLAAAGRRREAAAALAGESPSAYRRPPTALDVLWLLERARLAERAGDAARAAADYRRVAGLWAGSDAPLQPLSAEARAGLARTTARITAGAR